ncbi:MAG: FAD-dependent oxidoreductase [Lachnospiraceae bacterium]|nr:FAD-dependent oxidoreductase [Lachnospiraceae bacterium]
MKKSEKTISRRDFLRGATAGAVSFAAAGMFGGLVHAEESSSSDAIYTPGTYTATAMGIGAVTVTMTFDETSITEVVVDVSNETETIGQLYGETLQEALMEAQSAEIDGVSGATVTSDAVKEAAANCIAQAMGVAEALDATSEEAESGSWKDAPAAVDDSEIVESYDADVVVVGHGYAGLNACRYLAAQGVSVILIESQSEDSYQAMGNEAGTPNASALLELGVPEIDPIEYYNNWMVNSGYQANPGLVMKFCQNSGEAMDEYLSVLSEEDMSYMTTAFYPPTEHQMSSIGAYKFWPSTCSFYSSECNQTYIHQKNREKAIEDGATFMFSTEAQQLVMEDDEVAGLIATNADGDYIKFNCKAVILATGGFGANSQMQQDLLTDLGGCLTPDESFSVLMDSDGRGIQMGYWVGAKLDSLGIPTMNGKHYHPGYPQGVWLDADGKRYCNEYWGPIEFRGRPALQMQRSFYAFYDSKLTEYLAYSVPSHGSTYADEDNIASVEEELANALAAGSEGVQGNDLSATYIRYGAETLDELLDMVCSDDTVKANIKASIERYNELCEAGSDEDFGRESELMFPVKEGPFYCDIKVPDIGWMMCTCGGLVINAEQQVLNDYYKPIKGLFASGNCASGRFGTEYFTPTPGVSLGTAITLGRECGKSVEKFLNGEL